MSSLFVNLGGSTEHPEPLPQVRRRNVIVKVVCPIIVNTVFFTGLPSFAPAISFLKGAGQGHIVNQVKVVLEVLMLSAFVCFVLIRFLWFQGVKTKHDTYGS